MLVISPSLMFLFSVQVFLLLSQATDNGGQLVSMRTTEAAVEGMYTDGVEPLAGAVFVSVTAFVRVADIVGVAGAWVNVQVGSIQVAARWVTAREGRCGQGSFSKLPAQQLSHLPKAGLIPIYMQASALRASTTYVT